MKDDGQRAISTERIAALRICDANLNRACEGLRVVEEFYRFSASDALLARLCKELRHDLATLISVFSPDEVAKARETERDIGRDISTAAERERCSLRDVLAANWKRVEQALRVIEEYGKLLSQLDVKRIEQLRYRAYTIGKAIAIEQSAQARLADARLYVLIDAGGPAERFDETAYRQRVASLVSAGVHVLQLRDKTLGDVSLLNRAQIIRELTSGTGTLFIMNDRADLAVAAEADGVHLGQADLPVHEARGIVGTQALIGVSTHNIKQARQAVLDGADYIGCGPTFPSSTKHFDAFPGLELLGHVTTEITLPAFAIGGIDAANLSRVLETGVRRVAVSNAVWHAADPAEVVRRFVKGLVTSLRTAADYVNP